MGLGLGVLSFTWTLVFWVEASALGVWGLGAWAWGFGFELGFVEDLKKVSTLLGLEPCCCLYKIGTPEANAQLHAVPKAHFCFRSEEHARGSASAASAYAVATFVLLYEVAKRASSLHLGPPECF